MAGFNNDQKLAATITPPVKPSIGSNTLRLRVLKKNTREAPKAVTNQVNVVAISAALTGPIPSKKDTIESIALNFYKNVFCQLATNGQQSLFTQFYFQ